MAATDVRAPAAGARARGGWGPLVAAALALPGAAAPQTEPGPGPALVSFKWLSYRDWQPGLERIRVEAPAMRMRLPLGERLGLEGQVTRDRVSGASPRWHSDISSASRMSDDRRAGEVRLTRYERDSDWTVGTSWSNEDDFRSRALSLGGRWSTEDRNRSLNAGLAVTRDGIGSSDDPGLDAKRRTVEVTAGVTQALSRTDLVQLGVTLARGRGFYDDPYKRVDVRPDTRRQLIGVVRWNHHFEAADITLRTQWRGYRDSFGIRSHTLTLEPVMAWGSRVTVAPQLRLYTQSAASFYYDPTYSFAGAPYPPGWFESPGALASPDHRLSAFGALTVGLRMGVQLGGGWAADLRWDHYQQRSAWRLGGSGSPGLARFSARFVQWGVTRQF